MKNILFLIFMVLTGPAWAYLTANQIAVTLTGSSAGVSSTSTNSNITSIGYPTGNTGINSTAPGQALDVQGETRTTNITVSGAAPVANFVLTATDSSGDTAFEAIPNGVGIGTVNSGTPGQIGVYTATTVVGGNTTFVYTGGNMGIGTSAPGKTLDVRGTLEVVSEIVNGGNVGIGSLAPGAQMDVNGMARMTGFKLTANGSTTGYVLVGNSVGVGTWMAPASIGAGGASTQWTGTTGSTPVYMPSGTNVGIGSATPGQQLDVVGTIRTTSLTVSYNSTQGYVLTASDSSGDTSWGAVSVALRVGTTTSTATPSIASGSYDIYEITALATAMTSVTITGSPVEGQMLEIIITDNGSSQTLAWGSIDASTVSLPTATTISTPIRVFLQYNGSTWYCVGTA